MARQATLQRAYLISITRGTREERTAMRNAVWKLGGRAILPDLYYVTLTDAQKASLDRRFGGLRIRQP